MVVFFGRNTFLLYRLYRNVPKVFFPIFYTENLVTVRDQDAFLLRIFRSVPAVFSGMAVFMIVLGSVFVLYVCFRTKQKTKNTTKLENGVLHSSRIAEAEPLNQS